MVEFDDVNTSGSSNDAIDEAEARSYGHEGRNAQGFEVRNYSNLRYRGVKNGSEAQKNFEKAVLSLNS